MAELAFPLISIALGAPLLGALLSALPGVVQNRKLWPLLSAAVSAAASIEILRESAAAGYSPLAEPGLGACLFVDALSAAPLALFSLVSLGVIAALSNRDSRPGTLRAILLIQASTLAAYAAANPLVFVVGWSVSSWALTAERPSGQIIRTWRAPATVLLASSLCLAAGLAAMSVSAQGVHGLLAPWQSFLGAGEHGGMAAFVALMLAVAFRKGLFPVHSWIVTAYENGSLPVIALLVNGHLAAFLIARAVIPIFPAIATDSLPIVADLALLTALYAAILALAERSPRRILALLAVSQSSFVLAGLETATPAGVSGALVYWMVVTVATTALAVALRAIEQRLSHTSSGEAFLGLARPFPRLAAFFILCGVALVGMPGTLGFIADELLLHGALESHPQLGLVMPLAAALNAFHLYRLFSRLFLGSYGPTLTGVPDAKLGERLALTGAVVLLIAGGLLPARAVGLRSGAADAIVTQLQAPSLHGD